MPVLRFWRVFDREDLGPYGEQSRVELAAFLPDLDARATRFVERRDRRSNQNRTLTTPRS
jgi:acyl-[acyl-carrier-protein] desaturase